MYSTPQVQIEDIYPCKDGVNYAPFLITRYNLHLKNLDGEGKPERLAHASACIGRKWV